MQDSKLSMHLRIILILLLMPIIAVAQDWNILKSEHFIVYFSEDDSFASEVLDKAEKDYKRIAYELGYARYANFWTWDNRVKIYIYPDKNSYLEVAYQPEWSEGMADYNNKAILSYSGSEDFLISILPHEMAHLIFRDFVGFEGEIPLWLDEGVAQWEEEVDKNIIKTSARSFLIRKQFLSLQDLMKINLRVLEDPDKVYLRSTSVAGEAGFLIIDGRSLVELFYLESASLVGFLIERYGTDRFTEFCRQLRDGKDLEDALRSAYPNRLRSLEKLEERWIRYLKEE